MAQGECNCGAVAFAIDTPLKDVYICHCSICRRWSGTNGMAVLVVANAAFRWLRGAEHVRTWRKPDADWDSAFCDVCGSALPVPNDPERIAMPAGLIVEGGADMKVAAHIWTDSRAPWDVIGDDGRQYSKSFGED